MNKKLLLALIASCVSINAHIYLPILNIVDENSGHPEKLEKIWKLLYGSSGGFSGKRGAFIHSYFTIQDLIRCYKPSNEVRFYQFFGEEDFDYNAYECNQGKKELADLRMRSEGHEKENEIKALIDGIEEATEKGRLRQGPWNI